MKPKIPPAGELRQSQVLTTFGPGAMVDLPNQSVLIAGLEYWKGEKQRIYEDRLEAWLGQRLKAPELKLFAPPVDSGDPNAPRTGIDAFQFPIWFLGQVEETWKAPPPDGRIYRTRPMVTWDRLVKGGYLTRDRKVAPVVPVRFVQACVRGHIGDIDWYGFVRHDPKTERTGDLWLDEGGAGNDFAEIYVRDEKNENQRRPLSEASLQDGSVLGWCKGRSLRALGSSACSSAATSRTAYSPRSASNAYFSQTVSVHLASRQRPSDP